MLLTPEQKELGNKQIETSAELTTKFFFHWSLLAGATLTLSIPLITELINNNDFIKHIYFFKIAVGLLTISLVTSSIRNRIAACGFWETGIANLNPNKTKETSEKIDQKMSGMSKTQSFMEKTAISSYIIALILLYFFLDANIF